MKSVFEKIRKDNTIVSLYTDPDDAKHCYTGFIVDWDNEHVLLAHISWRGLYDGYYLRRIDDILYMEVNGEYEEKIHKLYRRKKQSHKKLYLKQENTLLDSILKYSCKKKLFISVDLSEDGEHSLTGTILETGDILCIQKYTYYGEKDSLAYIKKEDIYTLSIDTEQEQDLQLLSQY